MIYNVLASGVQQSESVIHIHVAPLFGLFCHLSHYRVLSATQSAECYRECCYTAGPYSYLFYIQWCGYVHPNLPIYPSPISRQEYWSGLPFPLSGDPPGIKPMSAELQTDSLLLSHLGSPINMSLCLIYTYKLHWRGSVISSQLNLPVLSPYTSIQYYINHILLNI